MKCFSNVTSSLNAHTLIHDSKLLPYLFWKASLISPKSISERLTIIRINVLSFVPMPAIELCKRSAKKSTFDLQHLAVNEIHLGFVVHIQTYYYHYPNWIIPIAKNPFSTGPLNSRLIASSISWPAMFSYSWNIWRSCWYERVTKIELKTDSSVPHCPSPASCKAVASASNRKVRLKYQNLCAF